MENTVKCYLCNQEETNGNVLCQACAELIDPLFNLVPAGYGTELARALAAELAPYLDEE
jgi:hypothetical protein